MLKYLIILVIVILLFFTGIFTYGYFFLSAPKYSGPISNHFNGKTFKNESGVSAKGFNDVLKWFVNRKQGSWSKGIMPSNTTKPEALVTNHIKVTYVNHSTILIQVDSLNIITDPVWATRVSPVSFAGPQRKKMPGVKLEDLPPIDIILISHNHYGHLDLETLKQIVAKHKPKIITPLGVGQFLKENGMPVFNDMDWWQNIAINKKVAIHCLPAQHFSGRGFADQDATLWCSYLIETTQGNIYFAGDTGYGLFFREISLKFPNINLALIPIGTYKPEWFMSPIHISPDEAVRVHIDLKAKQSMGIHFGTFPLGDDGENDPATDLKIALKKYQIDSKAFKIPTNGDTITVR